MAAMPVRLVQFPHFGSERLPKPLAVGATLPWNVGEHGRKYLVAEGAAWDGVELLHGEFEFWGEWEPPSVVERVNSAGEGLPQALQRPRFEVPTDGRWRQNTDPLVLGDTFCYSNCKQHSNGKLRRLDRGSVILFGSKLAHRFVLDTVFVVSSRIDYKPSEGLPNAGVLQDLVIGPLAVDDKAADWEFTLYTGASFERPVDGMFSFAPCVPHRTDRGGFARPAPELQLLNQKLSMGARVVESTRETVIATWQSVVAQVLEARLIAGTSFVLPERVAGDVVTNGRAYC